MNSTYDALDQLFSRTWSGGGIDPARVDFGYDANGNVTEIDRYADLAATQLVAQTLQQYDANGQLTHINDRNAVDQVFASYDYTLDRAGQLTQEIVNGQTSNYQYDQTGQLTQAASTAQPNEAYAYDPNGNRTGSGNVVGANNQITSDGTYNYAYDNNGNLIQKTEIATGNVTTLSYDYRNRLTDVVQKSPGGIVLADVHYTYDVFDRRIAQAVNGQTLWTVYDGKNAWADYNSAGQVVTRYLYGDGANQILARWQPGAGSVWYLTDHLGSVRDLVNSAGTVLDRITYNSYGLVLGQTNAAYGDRFLYTGQQYDAATGLYYYIGRYYDPVTGRFISQDPSGFGAGDANLYRYVGNHPTISIDPTGMLAAEDATFLNRGPVGALIRSGGFVARKAVSWSGIIITSTGYAFNVVTSEALVAFGLVGVALASNLAIVTLPQLVREANALDYSAGGEGISQYSYIATATATKTTTGTKPDLCQQILGLPTGGGLNYSYSPVMRPVAGPGEFPSFETSVVGAVAFRSDGGGNVNVTGEAGVRAGFIGGRFIRRLGSRVGDEAGHAIAYTFGGSNQVAGNDVNIFPIDGALNGPGGMYFAQENRFRAYAAEGPVCAHIQFTYNDPVFTARPSQITWIIIHQTSAGNWIVEPPIFFPNG